MEAKTAVILGIDGGGTGCRAAICDTGGKVAGLGFAGPANAIFTGEEEVKAALRSAVAAAREGLPGDTVFEAVYAAVPGTGVGLVRAALAEAGVFPWLLICEGDESAALHAGLGGGAGVVVLAGTGSFAVGRNEAGRILSAGGYGPVFGDEGSGYSIGCAALRSLGRFLDGLQPRSPFTTLLVEVLGVRSPADLRGLVYGGRFGRREIADLAREVAALAVAGDTQAAALLAGAGRDLARLAVALARRLGLVDREFPVALVGGLRRAGPPLLKPFARSLSRLAPSARPVEPVLPVLGGSLLSALAVMGVPSTREITARIKAGLEEKSGGRQIDLGA